MEGIKYYVEIRSTQRRQRPPFLAPLDKAEDFIGFRSVFAYTQEIADYIYNTGSTKGLKQIDVYCDTLFMDFDSHDPVEFRFWLNAQGYAYTEWDSGGRSVHFHIPIKPMFGNAVPRAVKAWVKQWAPTADVSFYHPAGIYRLPGTFHAKKPGCLKRQIASREGTVLEITIPTAVYRPFEVQAGVRDVEDFYSMLLTTQLEGGRRPFIWRAATTGFEAGLAYDEVADRLLHWNANFCCPAHDPEVVIKQIDAAHRRLNNAS